MTAYYVGKLCYNFITYFEKRRSFEKRQLDTLLENCKVDIILLIPYDTRIVFDTRHLTRALQV